MSKQYLECQNPFIAPNSNVKIGFLMSELDIRPRFECQNAIFGLGSNEKIGFQTSKCDIRREFERQNRISYVK